jgi:hypothetical protein
VLEFASLQRRLLTSRGLRLLVSVLTLPMLLASASRAEVILVHNHCGTLHFHFFSDGHGHDWHHEHERDHESVPCLCKGTDRDESDADDDEDTPHGLIIHVHELPRAGSASPALKSGNTDRFEFVPELTWVVSGAAQTAQDGRPPARARDDTGPSDSSRVCAILLANHALLL